MKIAITGATGFLGSEFYNFYVGKEKLMLIVRSHRREIRTRVDQCSVEVMHFDLSASPVSQLAPELKDCDVILHTAHSSKLRPSLPAELLESYQKANPGGLFVHISSLNTIIPALSEDPYTRHKRETEYQVMAVRLNIPLLIVRPSFVVSPTAPGSLKAAVSMARRFGVVFLPVPGPTHYFLPARFLVERIHQGE
jgi:nucleoside-diphosphate-sugar epimerase